MPPPRSEIVKVGGSLFSYDELAQRLSGLLAGDSEAHHVLIAGGGPWADAVRQAQIVHRLSDDAAHQLCVELLAITARLLGELLPEVKRVDDLTYLRNRLAKPGATVFSPQHFLNEHEPGLPGTTLSRSWDVTGDSIAARLAIAVRADRLVLLKSAAAPPGASLDTLSAAGYVDAFLPQLAAELPPLRLVNLRE